MRQELVDVSIMLQLTDKNNFHVAYSASSSANMPDTARLSAKVFWILQFYACTPQEDYAAHLHSLSHTHMFSHVQTHTFTHTSTHSHSWMGYCADVHIPELPGCLHIGNSEIHPCAYVVTLGSSLFHLFLRHNHIKFENAFT